MSPKFALAILLLSCVFLGMANAQLNRVHRKSVLYPARPRMNGENPLPPNFPPETPESSGGLTTVDCTPNLLASNIRDTRKPKPKL
ncbi:uncharacterized protein LOC113564060 [Drosophila erecta]|uniref:uncharacterized protein LOC113564060 n=1 Tax=Drosophila erecta TaxID=7220 RepID=UPI000F0552E1|nr:uncharacterized protein LOC113564060 [Drosophila erecta]